MVFCVTRQIGLLTYFILATRRLFQRMKVVSISASLPKGKTIDREKINVQAERILNTYGNNILRMAYSYLHNMSDAEDILQDTMIQFLKTMPTFESPDHEKAWLLRVSANLSKNKIDYNRIRKTDELEDSLIAKEEDDLTFVWEAIKKLPEKYREVIHLFHYEGYSTAEIARLLQRNEATVRSDLRRGRKKLKEILQEAYVFGEI